ncbi:hypothetical protein ARAM_007695 [Aspergillus rambellii]|uniref:Uncharacterized protein n=1 Tax=Aspergillus rambellii TaxID=308745 RepID=A0A0F8XGR9_9EURO|nr:hypothetical protein ARAM_007695 [Aspergillus rambellii]
MSQDQDHSLQDLRKPRHLLRGEITYSIAKEEDANIVHELGYQDAKVRYLTYLYQHRTLIESIVACHLGLTSANSCRLAEVEDWIDGSFNICIRVDVYRIDQILGQQVMIRFPLPYRVGQNVCPGNADEKIHYETGTYAWLQENCPDIPIPRLYGFGLSTGKTFTLLSNMPCLTRALQYFRRAVLGWLGYPSPSIYVPHRIEQAGSLRTGYILMKVVKL